MKAILLVGLSLLISVSQAQAFLGLAGGRQLHCQNGTIDQKGDMHTSVTISKNTIDVYYYESSFRLTKRMVDSLRPYITFANKRVIMTSEGVEYPVIISGSIVPFEGDKIQLNTVIDGYVSIETLTCR